MHFFKKHFTKHHLLRAPHKWFLAFLLSPIHYGQVHYHKRYHLRYGHARKLFIFDLALIASVFILIGTTLFWTLYDPTVTADVYLDISTESTRFKSGDDVTFTFAYRNDSDQILQNPRLSIIMPDGFIRDSAYPETLFNLETNTFELEELVPGASSELNVTGRLFATPEQIEIVTARLSYNQPDKATEVKSVHFELTPRGSILDISIEAAEKIVLGAVTPINLTLTNTGEDSINNITVPLGLNVGSLAEHVATEGDIVDNQWNIEELQPNEVATLQARFISDTQGTQDTTISFTPRITVRNLTIDQATTSHTYQIVRPSTIMTSTWSDTNAAPGDIIDLTLTITNNGEIDLIDTKLNIELPTEIINTNRLIALNGGTIQNRTFSIQSNVLETIPKNTTKTLTLKVPISLTPQGVADLSFKLSVQQMSNVLNVANASHKDIHTTNPIAVGTQLHIFGESRYYTNEGDQLGRGPLPPTIGKETKYWVFIIATNATSRINTMQFSATLPAHIRWTGKSSVTTGQPISYNQTSRTLYWSTSSVAPFARAGLYMELGYTPTASDTGTYPTLLRDISFSGFDAYINREIIRTLGDITANLVNDQKALNRGIFVE